MGRLATNNTDPTAVAANEIGRATRTSITMEVGLLPPAASAGVVVLSMAAAMQAAVVKYLVFIP